MDFWAGVPILRLDKKLHTMGHLNLSQRYQIEAMLKTGSKKTEIAKALGVDRSTVHREIKRNGVGARYIAERAGQKARLRQSRRPRPARFTPEVKELVERLIRMDFSPEQACGLCRANSLDCVSHERVYQHIWRDKARGGDLHTHLRRQGRKYRKRGAAKDSRGRIPDRVGIEERPREVEHKLRFGDLEVDTIVGRAHKGAVLTLNDRASGFLWMQELPDRKADTVADATIRMLAPFKGLLKTMTSDNGKEFAQHARIAKQLDVDFFFADPYSPWQRGANENLNGLIRQYIPKKTDLRKLKHDFVQQVSQNINFRPRKRFQFQNPIFVLNKLIQNSSVAFVT